MGVIKVNARLLVFCLSLACTFFILEKFVVVHGFLTTFAFTTQGFISKEKTFQYCVKISRESKIKSNIFISEFVNGIFVNKGRRTWESNRCTFKNQPPLIRRNFFQNIDMEEKSNEESGIESEQIKKDKIYMKLALKQAMHAFRNDEIPVGAVLVQNISKTKELNLDQFVVKEPMKNQHQHPVKKQSNECIDNEDVIIAACRNKVEDRQDASAHAEMECLKEGSEVLNRWRLSDCTLYVTLEPCTMCVGALQNYRIGRVVYATKSPLMGAVESYSQLLDKKHPFYDRISVTGGILENEASTLLKRFFKQRRSQGNIVNKQNQINQEEILEKLESEMNFVEYDDFDYFGNFATLI